MLIIVELKFAMVLVQASLKAFLHGCRAGRYRTFIIILAVFGAKLISYRLQRVIAIMITTTWTAHVNTINDHGTKGP